MRGLSTSTQPDVLVIGLGPAGASAAAAAARSGASVLALDRKSVPGLPIQCAEFVPAMATQETAAVSAATRQTIATMTTFLAASTNVKPGFTGHMIDRAAFDAALVVDARNAGATCLFDVFVRALAPNGNVTLSDGRTLRPRVVIAADGPRSIIGRALDRTIPEVAETRQITVPLLTPSASTDIFLAPEYVGGYAWLFPNGAVANLGLGVAEAHRHQLKPLLAALHAHLIREGRVGREIIRTTGGAIPVAGPINPVAVTSNQTVLFAGDAAGLTNPITGAGITAAVQSGELAGRAAAQHLDGNVHALDNYRDELDDLFGVALARAVARRRALLATYATTGPTSGDLRRAWIAFPEYWSPDPATTSPFPCVGRETPPLLPSPSWGRAGEGAHSAHDDQYLRLPLSHEREGPHPPQSATPTMPVRVP